MEHAGAKIMSCIGLAVCGPLVLGGLGFTGYLIYDGVQFGNEKKIEEIISQKSNYAYVEIYNNLASANDNLGEYEMVDNEKRLVLEEPDFEEAFNYLTEVSNGVSKLRKEKLTYPNEVYDISEYIIDYNLGNQNLDKDLENILELKEKVSYLEKNFKILAEKDEEQKVILETDSKHIVNTRAESIIFPIVSFLSTGIPGLLLTGSIAVSKSYIFDDIKYRPRPEKRRKNKP